MSRHSYTVVVTGASAGIGRATALRFARDGAAVALLARGRERLAAAAAEVEEAGGRALPIPTDVSDPDAVEAAAARSEAEFGPIDIWVNNAMATVYAPVRDMRPDEFRRVMETTYLGTVHGSLAALRRMLPRDRGTIVQVGSALAYRSIPLQSAYCAAKFAVRGFTDALRSELIHERSRVHVTMVQLAGFNTPQFEWGQSHMDRRPRPLPPVYQPEVAARGIHWAAHHRRRELWVGTPAVKTILANKLMPWLMDHMTARRAWSGQLSAVPTAPDRPSNLYEPPPGDYGVHGPYGRHARRHSLQLWATTHRGTVALLAAGAVLALGGMLWRPSGGDLPERR